MTSADSSLQNGAKFNSLRNFVNLYCTILMERFLLCGNAKHSTEISFQALTFGNLATVFLDDERRNELLAGTSIRHVRCVARRKFESVADVINVLEGALSPYALSPTQIEGVYLRCDDEATGTLIAR